MAKILLIDDDRDYLIFMDRLLRNSGHQTIVISNPDQLIPSAKKHLPDLVISDIMMPGITGAIVYTEIRQALGPDVPIIICSATSLKVGSDSDSLLKHCSKPINEDQFLSLIDKLLKKRNRITREQNTLPGNTKFR